MKKFGQSFLVILIITVFQINLNAQKLAVLTDQNTIAMLNSPANPNEISEPIPITGLTVGENIEGIDYRPNTGELYALAYNESLMQGRLYVINQTSGMASPIGTMPISMNLIAGMTGFDFNPTVDRIRVVNANGSNYRLHPSTGVLVATDGDLAFAANDMNSDATPIAVASGYTRSYIGTESTILYNIELGQNILTTQIPPNDGILNSIGNLGIDIASDSYVGFDIYYDEATGNDLAYVSATTTGNNNPQLFRIDLATGALSLLGTIGSGINIKSIAAEIDRTEPEMTGVQIFALSSNAGLGNLISFDSDLPSYIRSWVPLSGIATGQSVLGLDFRPSTKQLYAFGYNANEMNYQIYTVDYNSGVATAVNSSPMSINLNIPLAGFDFNPTVDRIRLIGAAGESYRLNPNDGALVATDGSLNFAVDDINAGTQPYVASVAYTNSYADATSTTLFGYDDMLNVLISIIPPNDGVCNTIASSGLMVNTSNFTSDMDIYFDSLENVNRTFFAANLGDSNFDYLYTIDENNMFNEIGMIGFGIPIKDIATIIGGRPNEVSTRNLAVENNMVSIYPNPVEDQIFIKTKNRRGDSFSIIDVMGRTVIAESAITDDIQMISATSFKSGIYFLRLNQGDTFRFIIK